MRCRPNFAEIKTNILGDCSIFTPWSAIEETCLPAFNLQYNPYCVNAVDKVLNFYHRKKLLWMNTWLKNL